MKNKSASQSVLVCLFTVAALAVYSSPARADTTTWTGASSADWFNDANWTNHKPSSSTDAFINNGGKPQINNSGATARSLTLGLNAGDSGTLTVNGTNGGSLDVVPQACAQDHPDEGAIYVGYGGRGTLIITNGGRVTSRSGYLAALPGNGLLNSNGAVKVDGARSTWTISGPCSGQLIISGVSETNPGGTALLSITNDGTVAVPIPSGLTEAVWVGPSGTLTGNGTITTTSFPLPTTYVRGTIAPTSQLSIDMNFRLDFSDGTMVCNVTPERADRLEISGYARFGGSLLVIMTGEFSEAGPHRYTLAHTAVNLDGAEFRSISIKYPVEQGFRPTVAFVDDHYVYLDLVWIE